MSLLPIEWDEVKGIHNLDDVVGMSFDKCREVIAAVHKEAERLGLYDYAEELQMPINWDSIEHIGVRELLKRCCSYDMEGHHKEDKGVGYTYKFAWKRKWFNNTGILNYLDDACKKFQTFEMDPDERNEGEVRFANDMRDKWLIYYNMPRHSSGKHGEVSYYNKDELQDIKDEWNNKSVAERRGGSSSEYQELRDWLLESKRKDTIIGLTLKAVTRVGAEARIVGKVVECKDSYFSVKQILPITPKQAMEFKGTVYKMCEKIEEGGNYFIIDGAYEDNNDRAVSIMYSTVGAFFKFQHTHTIEQEDKHSFIAKSIEDSKLEEKQRQKVVEEGYKKG